MEFCNGLILAIKAPPHSKLSHLYRPPKPFISLSSDPSSREKLAESLQSETLKILEWPSVCDQLSSFTSTSMGLSATRSRKIPLGRSPYESFKLLAQTSAAVAIPRPLDFSGIEDVSEIVDSSIAGKLASIGELCAVKRTLKSSKALFRQLEEYSSNDHLSDRYSPLLEIFQNCEFLMELEQKIGFCIDCKFSIVLDRASEELELIRSERKRNMEKLEILLKGVSAQIFYAGGIDRPLVTKRRSRMCVGIRASHRSLLPDCVVLNVSSSGATYFVEPKEAVDLNNMEVRLSNSEKIEEQAILSLLTSGIAQFEAEIKYLLTKILEIDLALARAGHARWMGAVCPVISSGTSKGIHTSNLSVDIEGIQHPLLLETSLRRSSDNVVSNSRSQFLLNEVNDTENSEILSAASDFPVPIDIKIGHETTVVVISGPNMGGKTASMKTIGLVSVMLKAGMYLPAKRNVHLPWFDLILADIGDNQSLEQSLSTFSGHMSRICKILEVASKKSLVLIDEIGSGTDPSEGVALSASLLQHFKDKVKLLVVTTHYADLTRLKEKDTRFENAAVEFSLKTLQPTYQILWGSAGKSNALNIAKLIGFDEKIIRRAQTWMEKMTPEKLHKWKGFLYQSLTEERDTLESQAKNAASLHSDIIKLYNEIRAEAEDLDLREAALKAKVIQEIQHEVQAAKTRIQNVIMEFENKLRTSGPDLFNSLLKKSDSTIASIVEAYCPTDVSVRETENKSYIPQLGEQVHVKALGNKLATVVEAPTEGSVLVQYGKVRVRVNISDVKAHPSIGASTVARSAQSVKLKDQKARTFRSASEASSNEEVSYGPVIQTSKNTMDLRCMRVEEASDYLNMAISTRRPNSVLFVIHGMGTGVIKECALEILRKHPRVVKFEQESPMNHGCTVAYIN